MTQVDFETDGYGRVGLTVPCEIQVPDMDHLTYEEWTRTIACPECRATRGLTLEARNDEALVICPEEGRAFRDLVIKAMTVRQLFASYTSESLAAAEVVAVPRGGDQPWGDMIPRLEEDRTIAPFQSRVEDEARKQWELGFGLSAEENGRPWTVAMYWARGLMTWALPSHGRLFQQVYGLGTNSAVEAHMIMVAMGLALYEAAFRTAPRKMKLLPLTEPMALLDPNGEDAAERRRRLRAVRTSGDPMQGGTLRLTDIDRLEGCSDEDWDRWCDGAFAALASHLKAARLYSAREHGDRLDPWWRIRLVDRQRVMFADDRGYTWYADSPMWSDHPA